MNAKAAAPDLSYIAEGLRPLAVPVSDLVLAEKNPRRGDVEALKKILVEFGQREPYIARRNDDGKLVLEAGNHRTLAHLDLGWTHAAVLIVDDDEARARAFSLVHNQSHEIGSYDQVTLAEMVEEFKLDDLGLGDLMATLKFDAVLVPPVVTPGQPKNAGGYAPEPPVGDRTVTPQFGVIIVCESEEEQVKTYEALSTQYAEVRVVTV